MARHGIQAPQKPIILSIENTTMCGSVAIVSKNLCICEYSLNSRTTHSRRLLDSVAMVMKDSQVSWPDIDAVAVSIGPGSFTGIRIGLTTAKGLVFAAEKKLITINTLDTLASQISYTDMLICPMIDARKGEVYTSLYRYTDDGILQRANDILSISPEKLTDMIDEKVLLLGDGSILYRTILDEGLGNYAHFAKSEIIYPRAATVGMLAIEKWHKYEFSEPLDATPEYIRASDAELNFVK